MTRLLNGLLLYISELHQDTKKIMVKFRYDSVSPIIERVFEKITQFSIKNEPQMP